MKHDPLEAIEADATIYLAPDRQGVDARQRDHFRKYEVIKRARRKRALRNRRNAK